MSFGEHYPKPHCGLLIKIEKKFDSHNNENCETQNTLFFGYVFHDCDYIYITAGIKDNKVWEMGWKALKEYDKDELFWRYDSIFLPEDYFKGL